MELGYKIYLTDTLYAALRQQMILERFVDLINPAKIDTRSGEEIALEVIKKAGLIERQE